MGDAPQDELVALGGVAEIDEGLAGVDLEVFGAEPGAPGGGRVRGGPVEVVLGGAE
ncbi:hypothetical protein ACIQY8_28980 [Streptomyces albidoflavus]